MPLPVVPICARIPLSHNPFRSRDSSFASRDSSTCSAIIRLTVDSSQTKSPEKFRRNVPVRGFFPTYTGFCSRRAGGTTIMMNCFPSCVPTETLSSFKVLMLTFSRLFRLLHSWSMIRPGWAIPIRTNSPGDTSWNPRRMMPPWVLANALYVGKIDSGIWPRPSFPAAF